MFNLFSLYYFHTFMWGRCTKYDGIRFSVAPQTVHSPRVLLSHCHTISSPTFSSSLALLSSHRHYRTWYKHVMRRRAYYIGRVFLIRDGTLSFTYDEETCILSSTTFRAHVCVPPILGRITRYVTLPNRRGIRISESSIFDRTSTVPLDC